MSVEARRDTDIEYLLVTFDVPDMEDIQYFTRQLDHIRSIYRYCEHVVFISEASYFIGGYTVQYSGLSVKRMRYGSPWQLLLTNATEHGPFVAGASAIGWAALRAAQKIMSMRMEWDIHTVDLERKKMDLRRDQVQTSLQILREFNESYQYLPDRSDTYPGIDGPSMSKAIHDLSSLPPITEAEILSQDDPRV